MENNKNYVIIHLINNQILINVDVTGLFSLPFFKDIKKMKKELNLASEDYIQGNIIKDKWYSTLIKEHYDFYNKFSMSNFYSNYLIITKPMINLENAQYISLDKLSELNFNIEIYPILIGLITKQIMIENNVKEIYKNTSLYEKNMELNLDAWLNDINTGITLNSYAIANKVAQIYKDNSKFTLRYKNILNTNILAKANTIILNFNSIISYWSNKFITDKKIYLNQALKYKYLKDEDVLYLSQNKNDYLDIINYFIRTKDTHQYSNYLNYIISLSETKYKKEIDSLLKLNLVTNPLDNRQLITKFYFGCYLILTNQFSEAVDVLVSCYMYYKQHDKDEPKKALAISYKLLICYILTFIINFKLSEFLYGRALRHQIKKDLSEIPTIEFVPNLYLKLTLDKIEEIKSYKLNSMTDKELLIYSLENISEDEFNNVKNIIKANLKTDTYDRIKKILKIG